MRNFKLTTACGMALLFVSTISYAVEDQFATWGTGLLGGLFFLIGLVETLLDQE